MAAKKWQKEICKSEGQMKVTFMPQNKVLEIQPDQTVKDLADKNGIFIKSICNGIPSCAECRVRVTEGEHNVLPPSTKETILIGTGYFIDQRRLSCQLKCFGDVTVDLTEQIEKEKTHGARRPQGTKKMEVEVSHAVAGNFLEQDADIMKIKTEISSDEQKRKEQPSRQDRPAGQRQHRHRDNKNNSQNRRQRS